MRASVVGLLTLAACAGLVVVSPRRALSPGPLTRGHGDLGERCLDCHSAFRGPRPERCTACHDAARFARRAASAAGAGSRARAILGLHRARASADCLACHTDHGGPDPARATRRFSHDALGPESPPCADCHADAAPRDDLHGTSPGACDACHRTSAWRPATFAHDSVFPLDRDHAVACRTCHDVAGDYRRYTCYGCHEHAPGRIRAQHAEEGITRDLDRCVRCHRDTAGERGEGGGD